MFWLSVVGFVLVALVYVVIWLLYFVQALLRGGPPPTTAGTAQPAAGGATAALTVSSASAQTAVPPSAEAVGVVRAFVRGSYNAATWEDMVARRSSAWGSSLIEALRLDVPDGRRDACAFAAAYALRERFRPESFIQTVWSRKSWSEGEISELLAIVEQRVRAAAASLVPAKAAPPRRPRTTIPTATEWGGFAPWAPFIDRGPVPSVPGVYVFAQHEDDLPEAVDPVARDVIYVGMTARSLAFRLVQFEQTALGGRGHTGGWSYRHEIARGDWDRLVAFRDTYVTWCPVGGGETAPRGVERSLLARYERRWGTLPRLNKAR